jgi:hypothetical protein
MRWIVEVISIGKTERQSYCVESDSWQRALQAARVLRSDDGPMTGFSIELLDEGFSAVDPMSRLRYFVKRAADDAPLSKAAAPKASPAAARPGSLPPQAPVGAAPAPAPAPAPSPAAAPAQPHPAAAAGGGAGTTKPPDGKKAVQRTVVFSSQGAAMVPDAAPTAPDVGDTHQAATAPAAAATKRPAPAAGSPPPAGAPSTHAGPAPQAHAPSAPRPAAASSPPAAARPVTQATPTKQPQAPSPAAPAGPAHSPAGAAHHPVAPSPPAQPSTMIAQPPTLPGIEVLFKREQEPDNRSPLTYREYVYYFAAGREETMARAMLFAQFELVKASISSSKPGKLVNLAMFDVAFKGKAPAPPVVTLTWKDWRGDPVIEFPRRNLKNGPSAALPQAHAVAPAGTAAALAQPVASPPHAAPSAVAPQQAPIQPVAVAAVVSPAGVGAGVAPSAASPAPAMAPQPVQGDAPFAAAAGPAPVHAAPVPSPLVPFPLGATPLGATPFGTTQPSAGAAAPAQPQPHAPAFPPVQGSLTPTHGVRRAPSKPTIGRLRGDELIADLFEAMHDLHFLRDAVEGADFCLSLALEKMPSRAGIVHLYDIDKREFVVTCARGTGVEQLLLHRYPESDPLLLAAMRKQRAIVIADATNGDAAAAERYQGVGGAKSVVVAPVILAGRFLGGLELVNPNDGNPFTEDEGHAMTYIGEQFAEFVATRGVTLDPERIMMKQSAPQRVR